MKRLRLLTVLALLYASSFALAGHAKPVADADVEDEGTTEETMPSDEGKVIDRSDVVRTAKDKDKDEDEGEASSEENEEEIVTLPSASKKPMVGKVGQTMAVQLDSKESQDFNLDLPKGQFFLYLDAQVASGNSTNATVSLLKRNGAEMPGFGSAWIYYNTMDATSRVGKAFSFAKPTGVRFRLKNDDTADASNFWLRVVPASPAKFLPFAFGSKLLPIKIGPNIGTGSTLDARGFQYLRATIPKGKWSISLGAKSEDNCAVDLDSYNERGVAYPGSIAIYGVGKEERQEKILTFTKPTTLIFRVLNDSQAENVAYDVTIEPSTD